MVDFKTQGRQELRAGTKWWGRLKKKLING